jgi:hypothetical protein
MLHGDWPEASPRFIGDIEMKIHVLIAQLILAAILIFVMPLYAWSAETQQADVKYLTSK